jgi:hypothetical protein
MERNKRVFRLLALSAAIGGAVFATAQAGAVDVRGSVRAGDSKPTTPESVRAPYWHEWNGFIEPKKQAADLTREVAVVLIGAEGMKDAATVALDNGALSPSTIVVQQGSALRIRNDDDFTHKLYAEGMKQFDAVETSSGQARQLQIDEEGSFAIYDVLAPHVRGVLHVLPKITKIANPQSDGTFKFSDVAPGTYTMKVFRGAFEVSSSTLEVPDKRELVVDPISVDVKNK